MPSVGGGKCYLPPFRGTRNNHWKCMTHLQPWLLLTEEILHQLISRVSNYLETFAKFFYIPSNARFLPSTVASSLYGIIYVNGFWCSWLMKGALDVMIMSKYFHGCLFVLWIKDPKISKHMLQMVVNPFSIERKKDLQTNPKLDIITKNFVRYLKWRNTEAYYKAIWGGGGFPLHKPYPYSLYRWGFLHFRYQRNAWWYNIYWKVETLLQGKQNWNQLTQN